MGKPQKPASMIRSIADELKKVAYPGAAGPYAIRGQQKGPAGPLYRWQSPWRGSPFGPSPEGMGMRFAMVIAFQSARPCMQSGFREG